MHHENAETSKEMQESPINQSIRSMFINDDEEIIYEHYKRICFWK